MQSPITCSHRQCFKISLDGTSRGVASALFRMFRLRPGRFRISRDQRHSSANGTPVERIRDKQVGRVPQFLVGKQKAAGKKKREKKKRKEKEPIDTLFSGVTWITNKRPPIKATGVTWIRGPREILRYKALRTSRIPECSRASGQK